MQHDRHDRWLGTLVAYLTAFTILACGAAENRPGARQGERAAAGSKDLGNRPDDPGAQQPKPAEKRHAEKHWEELDEDTGGPSEAWSIPYCEPSQKRSGKAYRPGARAATAYNAPTGRAAATPASQPGSLTPALHRALDEEVARVAASRRMPAPSRDARLARAASDLAAAVPRGGRIPYSLLDFTVRHHGIIEASPSVMVMWGPLFNPAAMRKELAGELAAVLASSPATRPFNRFGMASMERGQTGAGVVVMVLSASYIETRPIARELPDGGTVALDGNARAPYALPRVEVSRDNGDRLQPKTTQLGHRGFRANVACGGFSGRQIVEIKATVNGANAGAASHTLARFPIWCRARAPRAIDVDRALGQAPLASLPSTREIEIRLANHINRERRRCGLDDIEARDRLTDVAHDRSIMLASLQPGQATPSAKTAQAEIHAAGIASSSAHEFLARTFDIDDVASELFGRFGYRAAILSPRTTHMGLGVHRARASKGSEYFVSQLFVSVPAALTIADAQKVVQAMLRGRRGLVVDSELQASAEIAARNHAADVPAERVIDDTTRELRRKRTQFMYAKIQIWEGADIADFRPTAELSNEKLRHYGLSLARGMNEETGEKEFSLVLILAELKSGTTKSGADMKHH